MKEIVRVRYTKQENGVLISKEMLGNEHVITVKINSPTLAWKLVDKQGVVLNEGNAKTMADVKKHVKTALKGFGVKFLNELRTVKTKEKENV